MGVGNSNANSHSFLVSIFWQRRVPIKIKEGFIWWELHHSGRSFICWDVFWRLSTDFESHAMTTRQKFQVSTVASVAWYCPEIFIYVHICLPIDSKAEGECFEILSVVWPKMVSKMVSITAIFSALYEGIAEPPHPIDVGPMMNQ